MAIEPVVAPVEDNAAPEDTADKGETLLTGGEEGTTPPLADGDAPELPHAWMRGLTTEQKADAGLIESMSKFEKGIPDLAKSYAELEKKQSQAISVPNEKATEEEKALYRKTMGVPEKPEDYKLGDVELPDGITTDEAMQAEYLKIAHEANMSDAQANAVHQWYMKTFGEQVAAAQVVVKTTLKEAAAGVRERHGVDADAAKTYLERGYKHCATPSLKESLDASGFGNHPDMIDLFITVGKLVSEHPFVDGSRGEQLEQAALGDRSLDEIADTIYPKGAAPQQ